MKVEIVKIEESRAERFPVELNREIIFLGRGGQKEGFVALPRCKEEGEPVLSRIHCTLMQERGDWWFISGEPGGDAATNGCFLEGELIIKPIRLEVGQTFVLRQPPPCTIELQVSEDAYDLQDTLTPELLEVPQIPKEKIHHLEEAISGLHQQIRQNQTDDKATRAQAAALAAAVSKAVQQYNSFKAEVQTTQSELEKRLRDQAAQREKDGKQLARTISVLALAIAIVSGCVFFVERDHRYQYGEIVTELLIVALGGGGLYYANRNNEGE